MIAYLHCEAAREMLEPFVDDELPVSKQVMVESHLRWCDTCRARVEDMRLIASAVRTRSVHAAIGATENRALSVMQSQVLARIDAERDQSLRVRFRELFIDMRLLWPALGGTIALLACLAGLTAGYGFVRAERPDSMAALLSALPTVSAPRTLPQPPPLPTPTTRLVPEGEAVFLLSAEVTRGGRVATYELLRSERAPADEVTALVDALKYSHLAPARAAAGSVNVVWLLAHTTVKGTTPAGPLDKPLSGGRGRTGLRPAHS
jgi:putative zinc finger protein